MRILLCYLVLCLCLCCGCATGIPPTTSLPAPTKPAETFEFRLSPTPTALPLPPGHLPSGYSLDSRNWSGYVSLRRQVEGIRAQWIEPDASGQPGTEMAMWIGVGGVGPTFNELVQIGTLAYSNAYGHTVHKVWYEMVPQLSQVTSMLIAPGDSISAVMELAPGSKQQWSLALTDETNHSSFSLQVTYSSRQEYADFIVEDPYLHTASDTAPLYPFPSFASVRFTGAQVKYADGWYSLGALSRIQMMMIQNGKVIATPGSVTLPDTFSVTGSK